MEVRETTLTFSVARGSGPMVANRTIVFARPVDKAVAEQGKVRMLAVFHDFHGWDAQALWDDIKFSTTHCTKIERIALVGETAWEKGMAAVCKPFTMAKIQYFDAADLAKAKAWLAE